MSGLFDSLESELENRDKQGGISPLDLIDLPSALRKLMRHMLREVEVTFDQLLKSLESIPEIGKMKEDELKKALNSLTKQGWIIQLGEKENLTYKVNLRRKASSNLPGSIWAALGDKIEKRDDADPAE